MRLSSRTHGFKLIELVFTLAIVSVLGLVLYSLLATDTILGAKNTAVNTAHQQARVAMLQMVNDIHSAVSLPLLTGVSGNTASGITFQQWGAVPINGRGLVDNGGPHKILQDENVGNKILTISVTPGPGLTAAQSIPRVGQRLIIPTHQIEADISAVSGGANNLNVTIDNIYGPALAGVTYPRLNSDPDPNKRGLPIVIKGTDSDAGDIVCFVTDRCSYTVANNSLTWTKEGSRVLVNDITSDRPFSTPVTPAGALYYKFVSAIDLSTADLSYSNRGFKSANVFLNGQVPIKAKLTTFQ
jgi:type II secretory pathway pseudopilin PulG